MSASLSRVNPHADCSAIRSRQVLWTLGVQIAVLVAVLGALAGS